VRGHIAGATLPPVRQSSNPACGARPPVPAQVGGMRDTPLFMGTFVLSHRILGWNPNSGYPPSPRRQGGCRYGHIRTVSSHFGMERASLHCRNRSTCRPGDDGARTCPWVFARRAGGHACGAFDMCPRSMPAFVRLLFLIALIADGQDQASGHQLRSAVSLTGEGRGSYAPRHSILMGRPQGHSDLCLVTIAGDKGILT
jgi:hypothetical protein